MSEAEVTRLLGEAQRARAGGRADVAEAKFRAVLALAPDHAGALNALGAGALARQDAAAAAELFERAANAEPSAPALWINLAKAKRLLGDGEGERHSLTRVLEIDQRHLVALIRIAELHERLGEMDLATQRWSAVLALGTQVSDRSAEFDAVLVHASAFVAERTRRFGERIEESLGAGLAAASSRDRRRFTAAVDHMLGRRAIFANQCAGLHYPFLPADEFFDREHFPWLAGLEAHTATIREEFEALLAGGAAAFTPYVAMDKGVPDSKWAQLDHSRDWSAFHLWREGARIDEACARCPRTAEIVENLPLARMESRAPTVFFSVLRPGTRIPPHTGVSNVRAIVHLPLVVPEGCGFRVGGETRQWKVGEAFVFDDTIEHEAWNDSAEHRAVLILDTWNPHLGPEERDLVGRLFALGEGDEPGATPGSLRLSD